MRGQRLTTTTRALGVALALGLGGDVSAQTGSITTASGGGPGTMPATQASLRGNVKVVSDQAGNLYISDGANHRVYRFDRGTGALSPFAGTGFPGSSGDDGPALQARLSNPYGLALDETRGVLYIADIGENVIRAVDLATGTISRVAGTGICGHSGDGGPAASAQVCNLLSDLALDAGGTLYFATEFGGWRIRAVQNGIIDTVAGNGVVRGGIDGQGGDASDDYLDGVPATNASLGAVTAVAVGGGSLYFYEQAGLALGGARYRRVDLASGTLSTYAGNGHVYGQIDGTGGDPADDVIESAPALQSALAYTTSMSVAPGSGELHVAMYTVGLVRAVSRSGDGTAGTIVTLAGGGPNPPRDVPPLDAFLINPTGVHLDANGTSYIAAASHIGFGAQVFAFDAQAINPAAGNGYGGYCGDGGATTAACLTGPTAVRHDPAGNLLIADGGNQTVRSVSPGGIISSLVSSSPFFGQVPDLLPLAAGGFLWSSSAHHTVFRAEAPYSGLQTFAGTSVATGSIDGPGGDAADDLGDGELAWVASLNAPAGLARDAQGHTFVADSANHRVRRVDGVTGLIGTVAGTGNAGFNGDGLPGTSADLNSPYGLAFDQNGDLLVTEREGHRVRRIAAGADGLVTGADDETVSTLAGTGEARFSGDGGDATLAMLDQPTGLAVDAAGNTYVADTGNHAVRRVDVAAGTITTISGRGVEGDGVPAVDAVLELPLGLSIHVENGTRYLYVADAQQNRVRRIDLGPAQAPVNQPPVVQPLGLDGATLAATSPAGATIALYADATDPDGDPLTYSWSGPFGAVTGLGVTVRLPIGVHTVTVAVDDGHGHVATASATVTVRGENTFTGDGEVVTPLDDHEARLEGETPGRVSVTFLGPVTTPGLTWFRTRTDQVPAPLAGTQLGSAPFYYDIATTAVASGDVRICLDLTGMSFAFPNQVELHRLGGAWVALGASPDPATRVVCAQAPFAEAFGTHANFTPADSATLVSTVAGNGQAEDTGDGGAANQAGLYIPEGLAFDAARNVLYIGLGSHRVRRVNLDDGRIETVAGTGSVEDPVDGVDALHSSIGSIAGLALDADGNLFIGDKSHCLVRRVDVQTHIITTVGGSWRGAGLTCGHTGDGGLATAARLGFPHRLAFDAQGNLLFVEQPALAGDDGGYIRRIAAGADQRITGGDDPGETISSVAGNGTQDPLVPDGGHPLGAGLFPFDLEVGPGGALYVAENNGVLRLAPGADGLVNGSPDETLTRVLGDPTGFHAPFQGDGGPGRSAYSGFPSGLAVLANGDVLVAQAGLRRIRRISAGADGVVDGDSDERVVTIAGFSDDSNPPAFNGDGYALSTRFAWPVEVALDGAGGLFVADPVFHRVRRVGLSGGGDPPASADLEMTLATATPNPVGVGAVLRYEARFRNNGPGDARLVTVSMQVPATLAFVGSQPVGACSGPAEGAAGTIGCGLGDLAAGATNSVFIDTRPLAGGPLDTSLSVFGSAEIGDPDVLNNELPVSLTVVLPALVIEVEEPITVDDDPAVTPSVLLDVEEPITVSDDPAATPSVMLDVEEPITVDDTPVLTAPLLTVSPASAFPNGTTTLSARLTSLGTPVGGKEIAFSLFGTAAGTATTNMDGVATVTGVHIGGDPSQVQLAIVPVGTYPGAVQASFAGDADLGAASGSGDLTVSPWPTSMDLVSSLNPSVVGDSVTFTATVSSPGGVPTGTIEFRYEVSGSGQPIVLGRVALAGAGVARLTTSNLSGGNLVVTASTVVSRTSSDETFAPAKASIQQTVAPAPTTTTLTSTSANTFTTRPPVFTATVGTAASLPATGTVEFFANGASIGTSQVFERGGLRIAVMGGATLGVGTHTITAEYSGDGSHLGSAAGPLSQNVILGDYVTVDSTPTFTDPSYAIAVNANDQVVVVSSSPVDRTTGFATNAGFIYAYDGGGLAALGGLGGTSTIPFAINDAAQVVGVSATAGGVDHAFLWQSGQMTDLGTLGGGTSRALAINNLGQVVGISDTASGTHAFFAACSEVDGFQCGMLDLGTLGGSNSAAVAINASSDRIVAVGFAERADGTRRAASFDGPDTNPARDLGTLGGTNSRATAINDAWQIVGTSHLAGDVGEHPFLWQGGPLIDIAGVNGPSGTAVAINDAGQVVGWTFLPGASTHLAPPTPRRAFFYSSGQFMELGTLSGGTSQAVDVSNAGLVVGQSDGRAFVSSGGALRDLGTLGGPTSVAIAINDRGVIVGSADTASGLGHAVAWYPVPVPTLTVAPATAAANETVSLRATLMLFGQPLPNQQIVFTLNGAAVGSATTLDTGMLDTGTATLPGVSLAGLSEGRYAGAVHASYAGSNIVVGRVEATGDLTVTPSIDHPPVAADDAYAVGLPIPAPGVLGNDVDVDGDALTAVLVSGPSHGTVSLALDGSFTYTPTSGTPVADAFTYQAVGRGVASNVATVSLLPTTIHPVFGGVVSAPPVAINDGAGDQNDPHVDGDLASYTNKGSSSSDVRYYSFGTGADAGISQAPGETDFLSDVSGGRISFSRRTVPGNFAAMVFDARTQQLTEIDPQPITLRLGTAIGGDVVAFVEALAGDGDVFAWDLPSSSGTNVSASIESNGNPSVSPDGSTLVWQRWQNESGPTLSDVFLSRRSGGAWGAPTAVTATPDNESNPDTDGTWIVFDRQLTGTESDIYLRPVAGGPEARLALPGLQLNANVHRGVISFESTAPTPGAKSDLFVYVIATNTLYQVTDTPTLGEHLNDVSVLANGDIRLVWAADDSPTNDVDHDVHAVTFTPSGGVPALVAVASGSATICEGASTPLSGWGGVSCSWSPATGLDDASSCTPMASPAATTTYTLTVTDAHGRTSTNDPTVTVTVNPRPVAVASGSAAVFVGQSAPLSGSGGDSCRWSPAAGLDDATSCTPSASPTVTTTYSLVVTSAAGCASTNLATATVTIRRTLAVTLAGSRTGSVTSSPGGIQCGAACTAAFDDATAVTLTATPDPRSVFGGWSGDPDCADGVVTMNGDIACTASFEGAPDLLEFLVWAPASTRAGTPFTVIDLTLNLGTASANASNTRLFLSTDAAFDPSDRPLAVRPVPPLPSPGASLGVLSVVIPTGTAPSRYYLIAVADADRAVAETNEGNNVSVRPLAVR